MSFKSKKTVLKTFECHKISKVHKSGISGLCCTASDKERLNVKVAIAFDILLMTQFTGPIGYA